MARAAREVARLPGWISLAYWEPGGEPGLVAAVEYPHVLVAEITQQPPAAGGGGSVPLVIHDHGLVLAHPGRPHRRLEGRRIGQRMPPTGARPSGQVTVEVDKDRPRQVPLVVAVDARRTAKPPPYVQQDRRRRAGQLVGEVPGRDEQAVLTAHRGLVK